MSGRSCSVANTVFFEADALALEVSPERVAGFHDAAVAKLSQQRVQGQIRFLGQARQQLVALVLQQIRALAAHRLGSRAARRSRPLRPLHDARNADVIQFRHRAARLATRNQPHNTLTQIQRVRSRHSCWPPTQQES